MIPKAIIFDWDNTLIDTYPIIHKAINKTMEKMNKKPWSFNKVKNDVNKSMRESFPEIFGDKWEEAGKIYHDSYKENHLNSLVMLPNSLELLKLLVKFDIKLFVVSNKVGNTLRTEAENLKINKMFFNIIGATDAKYDKPSKDPVEMVLFGSEIDTKKDLVWFVGDSYVDIQCALNSDCFPIFLNERKPQDLLSKDLLRRVREKTGKDLVYFNNHQEIINYLLKINS